MRNSVTTVGNYVCNITMHILLLLVKYLNRGSVNEVEWESCQILA
jgi:hypothetical protein